MSLNELILSSLLLTLAALFIYYIFKEKVENDDDELCEYSIEYLCEEMKQLINGIVNMDIDALSLNKRDLENRRALKRSLSDAIRKCSCVDKNAKMIVMQRIKNTLVNRLGITPEVIDQVLPFSNPGRLSSRDQFEILMYLAKRDGNYHMFSSIVKETGLDNLKKDDSGFYYDITHEDIKRAYQELAKPLSYDDKLNVLTQRIYEETYGLSVVDFMIMEDASLDGVSGGISGITTDNLYYMEEEAYLGQHRRPKSYESVWVIFGGKPIHMKFLSFPSNASMIRICKNLSEYGRSGHMTSTEGGIKTHLADGSRVTVFRPNNATQWAFFVRKCANTSAMDLKDLLTDEGNQYVIGVIKWAIHGCVNIFFSGDQNSGKTTYTRAAIREIDRRQPIRTLEADFELYLNDSYADKNILGTRPSERLPFPKLIELLKASDAHTILFGETASLEHAKHLIDLLLAGTKRIITTGHWPTTDELVSYLVHSMGGYGKAGSQELESMIARLVHLDVHCVKENDGHRHIDRITEVIPYDDIELAENPEDGIEGKLDLIAHYLKVLNRKKTYYTRDIVRYEDGKYKMVNPISENLSRIIIKNLPPEERNEFFRFNMVTERGA